MDKTDDVSTPNTLQVKRSRELITANGYRYTFNNFGSGRQFKFFICINSYVPVRLEALELVIAQGTH